MSIIRWNPSVGALSRWPSIWDEEDFPSFSGANNLDVYETQDEVVVKANVAGVPADKVDVTYDKGVLWIQANAQESSTEGKKHYSRSSWSYSYKVSVPGEIDVNLEPSAEVEDGVIKVTFKKSPASKPKKLQVSQKGKSKS